MKKYSLILFTYICCGKLFAMDPAPVCGDGVVGKFFEEVRNYDAAPVGCFCCNRLAKKEKKEYTDLTTEMETLNTPEERVENITVLKKIHHFSDKSLLKILVVWESTKCSYEDFFKDLSIDFFEDKTVSDKQSRHFFAELKNSNEDKSCFCEFIFLPADYVLLCKSFQNEVDMVIDCFDYLSSCDKMGFYNDCQKKFDLADLFIKGKSTKTPLFLFGLWHPKNQYARFIFNSVRHCFENMLSKEELSFVYSGVWEDGLKKKLIDLLFKSSCH